MRLYRLTMRAIGPFAGEHTVDFERLGASGLFLLEGPTGSGKSTVIDAVVFALYGQVAGSDASNDRMHSDFADPSVEPFVQLDFETTSGLYRVRRTPKYERPKTRGEGTTTQNATAKLWRLGSPDAEPDGDAVATTVTEASAETSRAVGLSREQFVKTVVLPQGEFAAFLRAGAEERRELLQRLFGTELYERVQRQLEDQRRAAQTERREAQLRVREAVAAFGGAVGLDEVGAARLDALLSDPDDLGAALGEHLQSVADVAAAADVARRAAEEVAATAEERLRRAEQHEERRQAKAGLLAEQAELAAGQADVDLRRRRAEHAERAARVGASIAGLHEASARAEDARTLLERAQQGLASALRGLDPATWETEERRRRDAAAALGPLLAVEASLADRAQEAAGAERELDELRRRRAEVDQELVLLPDRLARLRAQEEAATLRAAGADRAEVELAEARARLVAVSRCDELTRLVTAAAATREQARAAADAAQDREHRLRRAYIGAVAGHLAADLADGEPCPVCGSTSHPRPARRDEDAVGAEDVDEAERVRVAAVAALESANGRYAELAAERAVAAAAAGGQDLPAAQAAVTAAEVAAADAQLATSDAQRLRTEREEVEQRERDLQVEATKVLRTVAAAEAGLEQRRRALDGDRLAVAEGRRDDGTVAARVARLEAEAAALQAARAAALESAAADRAVGDRRGEAASVAEAQGFVDVDEAEAALLPADELARLLGQLAEHDRRVTEVAARLADPLLAEVDADDVTDLAPLAQARAAADEAAQEAQAGHARAEQRSTDAQTRSAAVGSAQAELAAVQARTAPVIRMADLVAASTGDNTKAMTLPTFVLLERFRDVVAAANQRLSVMSDGRYGLEHVVDKEGGKRSGLGLLVRDNHTEKARHPTTLSGGETFYCSLALALGLADVVTAEAGGIDLGTLFVDEGFGTLDPDTLDQVVTVLAGLRSGGRTVGIVSHVAELRDRISERVEVRRTPDGSSTLEVVA